MKRALLCISMLYVQRVTALVLMQGNLGTMHVENQPLGVALQAFEKYGIEVWIDESLAQKEVTGYWDQLPVDRLVAQLAHPHDYVVSWRRMQTPLGALEQLHRISIFSDTPADQTEWVAPSTRKNLTIAVTQDGQRYVKGELLIGFHEGSTMRELQALLHAIEDALTRARLFDGVNKAELNRAIANQSMPQIALGSQVGVNATIRRGEPIVAVLDSGFDPAYTDANILVGYHDVIDPEATMHDPTGHGTLVSLVASGAVVPAGEPMESIGTGVLAIRVFDDQGMTCSAALYEAFNYGIEAGAEVFNISFGTYEEVGFFDDIMAYADAYGVQVVVAAGNEAQETSVHPAAHPDTISVGAHTPDGQIAPYSNFGESVDMYRNGTVMFNGKVHQGTSFAAPRLSYELSQSTQN
jgi:hypothetical protein